LAAPATAEVRTWTASTGGSLTDPANWSGGLVPGAGDSGLFDLGATYTVTLGVDFETDQFRIGADDVTLDLGSSTLTLARDVDLIDPSLALGLQAGQTSSLTLQSGTMFTQFFSAGAAEGAVGAATVSGATTGWQNNSTFAVGDQGRGTLSIINGARVVNGPARVGLGPMGDGEVMVGGAGTTWTNGFTLRVGVDGLGSITVDSGAFAEASSLVLGQNQTGDGDALVNGSGSQLGISGAVEVGRNGAGSLLVDEGATLNSSLGTIGVNGGGLGDAVIRGAESRWDIENGLTIGSSGVAGLTIENGAEVTSRTLQVSSGSGAGDLTITGGGALTVEFEAGVSLTGAGLGSITINEGALTASSLTIGTSGRLTGVGTVTANVVNTGVITAGDPLGVLIISGSFDQSTALGGALLVSIGPETTALGVGGPMTLGGRLTVSLAPGFTPAPGDEFLVAGANSRTGEFQTVQLPPAGGGVSYSLEYRDALVVVVVEPTADINGDGQVDGADLGSLLSAWGTDNSAADLNGDGLVDGADLGSLLSAWTG